MSLRQYRVEAAQRKTSENNTLSRLQSSAHKVFVNLEESYQKLEEILKIEGVDQAYNYYQASNLKGFPQYRTRMGVFLIDNDRMEEAYDVFSFHVACTPKDMKARQTLGDILRELGDFDEARDVYHEILKINPSDKFALNSLGHLEMKDGYIDLAYEYFDKVLENNPEDGAALNSLGILEMRNGDLDAARELFEAVLAEDPNNAISLTLLNRLNEEVEREGAPADNRPKSTPQGMGLSI